MSKIDKKVRILSNDVYEFSKDEFRKSISILDPNTLEIKLKPEYNIFNYNEGYDKNNQVHFGFFEMNCANGAAPALVNSINSIKDQDIYNTNLLCFNHKEINEEVKKQGEENLSFTLKFDTSFIYSYLSKNYETFLNDNKNISELKQPNFYQFLGDKYINNTLKKFIGQEYFVEPQNVIDLNNTRSDLKNLIFDSKLVFNKALANYNGVLGLFNTFAPQFPFYSDIKIDYHNKPENNISDLFHDKNLYRLLLEYASGYNTTDKVAVSNGGLFTGIQQINKTYIGDSSTLQQQLINRNVGSGFFDKLLESTKINTRRLPEIIDGAETYSEVIGYVLNKYDTFGPKSTPIQQIILPNLGNDSYVNYIDTQIKYNKRYKYTVDLLVLSVDVMYRYKSAAVTSNTSIYVDYSYQPRTSFYLIKNNVEYTNKLLSYPPVKPYVEFLPYVDMDNKFKLTLYRNSIQKTIEKPISINASDETVFEDLKEVQNSLNNTIKFLYDDGSPTKFEIYKTVDKPSAYTDFNGKLLTTIEANDLENASYQDTIAPNKYYYYIFKAIDYHNQFSNPTEIYEVIYSNGSLNIKTLDIKIPEQESALTFRRFLQVSPSIAQLEAQEGTNDVVLGINKDSLWDKKFKIRLTSRSTGKKIDLNLTFKYNTGKKRLILNTIRDIIK
jgi:hypothetical protein